MSRDASSVVSGEGPRPASIAWRQGPAAGDGQSPLEAPAVDLAGDFEAESPEPELEPEEPESEELESEEPEESEPEDSDFFCLAESVLDEVDVDDEPEPPLLLSVL